MATKVTTKKPLTGNRRSHALNATKMKQKPNLQKKTINGEEEAGRASGSSCAKY